MVAQATTRRRAARGDRHGRCGPELLRIVARVSPDGEGAAGSTWPPVYSTVQAGPARVRVAVAGEGPPLLLLSGIGGNIEMWEPAARHLTGRRLVMLDVPGTGCSPALRVGLRMRGYAQLVTRVLDGEVVIGTPNAAHVVRRLAAAAS